MPRTIQRVVSRTSNPRPNVSSQQGLADSEASNDKAMPVKLDRRTTTIQQMDASQRSVGKAYSDSVRAEKAKALADGEIAHKKLLQKNLKTGG